jgi:hypothetical protein
VDTYHSFKNDLLKISLDISSLISDMKTVPGAGKDSFEGWEKTCREIPGQLSGDSIRVAVVGSIKSGKSTFVNALFRGDYLKRGAGVVTSVVTRVCRGDTLEAKLRFKSWDEVNAEMAQALILFPSLYMGSENEVFDIRQDQDRIKLRKAIDGLDPDLLIGAETRNMNSTLLMSYLKGYDRVKDILSPSDTAVLEYKQEHFPEHKAFAGDDTLAVYLKDIRLEIATGDIYGNTEIADCQGSDSPNPLHLAMIQDYLLLTHLIVYVISGRIGLRQADLKFLSVIRKMGILDNIVFIVNFDFNEHESQDDLNAVVERIREDLSLIKPEPEIYIVSALFNLFGFRREFLPHKDRSRLLQWESEKDFCSVSDRETRRFESDFNRKVTDERNSLLLKNHLERVGIISSGLFYRIGIHRDILSTDALGAENLVKKISHHQKRMKQIRAMTETALDGMVKHIRQGIRADVDRFFDTRSGEIPGNVFKFIRNYDPGFHNYEQTLRASNVGSAMYLLFQEFRHAADMFMAESIFPEIIRFVREKEKDILNQLESVKEPYHLMAEEALAEYHRTMKEFGISRMVPEQENRHTVRMPDTDLVKRTAGLTLPPLSSAMRYSAKIKTEAILRSGFYSVIRTIKKLLKRPVHNEREGGLAALKIGLSRLKHETEQSVTFQFKDYRENLKFQYLFKLTDALSGILHDLLADQFQTYISDLSQIAGQVGEKQTDKEEISQRLKEMEERAAEIGERISRIRSAIIHP